MEFDQLAGQLDSETIDRFRRAIEIGKWPDGKLLSDEQKAICLQAVIYWESRNLPEEERTGYIDKGHKEGDQCDSPEQPVNWRDLS